jgi:hypothetical protein
MLTVTGLLLVGALILCIVHAAGKCPLWPAVLLVIVVGLLGVLGR